MDAPTPQTLLRDDLAWDRFVAGQPSPPIAQLTAWAHANAPEGWGSVRVTSASASGCHGAQLLLHRMRPGCWQRGYAAHGPVGAFDDRESVAAFTTSIRAVGRRLRLSHVLIDPELPRTDRLMAWLAAEGWLVASPRRHRTRIIDLDRDEAAIFAGFESRCRRSIRIGVRVGVRVEEGGEADLPAFHGMYADTMRRAGRAAHPEAYFRSLWADLAPSGRAQLLLAMADGSTGPLAATLLVACGQRVTEVCAGTTLAGEACAANHVLKWQAMCRARAAGYLEYDMYGLPTDGVALFKRAFGGREVEYVGYQVLVIDPIAYHALGIARWVRGSLRSLVSGGSDSGDIAL